MDALGAFGQREANGSSLKTEEQSADTNRLMTAIELARRLRLHRNEIYRLVKRKAIPAIPIGGRWRFEWNDVLAALKNRSDDDGVSR